MDMKAKPSPRLEPLPVGHAPGLEEAFAGYTKSLGFIPNSMLVMQRRPKMVKAFAQLAAAVYDPEGEVDRGFKRLLAHVASRAAGCQYCMAHTAGGALLNGVDPKKVEAIWDFRTSPLYSEGEKVALDFAIAAAGQPNGVTDEMFAGMRKHWNENQVVEITGVVAMFGFLNRWNDTMATPLEPVAAEAGAKFLGARGWSAGKHGR